MTRVKPMPKAEAYEAITALTVDDTLYRFTRTGRRGQGQRRYGRVGNVTRVAALGYAQAWISQTNAQGEPSIMPSRRHRGFYISVHDLVAIEVVVA